MVKELAFRVPCDNAPAGVFVKVDVPSDFFGVDKYKRVNELARLVYNGCDDMSALMLLNETTGQLYVDDCALIAVAIAQKCAANPDRIGYLEKRLRSHTFMCSSK